MAEEERLPQILARIPSKWGKYLSFGPGWDQIVTETDEKIAAIYPDYEIHQVKEKFGGLRFYCEKDGVQEVQIIIDTAEEQAWHTCEECGSTDDTVKTGTREGQKYGWIRTLCDACRAKRRTT